MKRVYLKIFLVLISADLILAQGRNCSVTSIGDTSLTDLVGSGYKGIAGGLYFPNTNTRPAAHDSLGLVRSLEIAPRDANGVIDYNSGKIVLINMGHSQTARPGWFFTDSIKSSAIARYKNPYVVFVNCGVGGQNILQTKDSTTAYWAQILDSLSNKSVTKYQVQVIFFHSSMVLNDPCSWPTCKNQERDAALTCARVAMVKFPNLKMFLIESRQYAGYRDTGSAGEPKTYQQSFGMKEAIDAQIQGIDSVSARKLTGTHGLVPYIDWLFDMWSDGTRGRSDGWTWDCDDFDPDDGTHPSDSKGRRKVATKWLTLLKTDPRLRSWFLRNPSFYAGNW